MSRRCWSPRRRRTHWALFGYLAIVLVAARSIARLRDWTFLAAAAFAGIGLWTLLYLGEAPIPDLTIVMFISPVTLGALALVWLGCGERRCEGARLAVVRARLLRGADGGLAARRFRNIRRSAGSPMAPR